MLTLYTGTPGSGKSYHATERIDIWLRQGKNVISTYPIKVNNHHKGIFTFVPLLSISVDYLLQFFKDHHKPNKEDQTLVVIDECHIIFNSREFNNKARAKWLQFLALSRHYGYDFILITQNDRAIDRQIRGLVEYNIKHRNLAGFGLKGWLLIFVLHKKFVAIKMWYVNNEKCTQEFFNIRKRVTRLYDTFAMFDDYDESLSVPEAVKIISPAEFNAQRKKEGEQGA